MKRLTVFVLALALSLGVLAGAGGAQEVKLGSLNDMTGPTSDVGKDVALGIREARQYVNDTGGINGKKIRLYLYDYGYRVPEAITTYKRFRDFDKVPAVLGWGTGDTEALSPTVNKDRMPYLSHSFSAHITAPKKTTDNFVYGTDYSSNARVCKPRFVALYAAAVPYASAPIKAIKDQATLLGFEIGKDQDIPLTALDTK